MPDPAPPPGAVFLSYAREDTDAARRIADALRAFGVEVWFDQNELRGGDSWDAKIRTQIRSCTLFVPIISAQTQSRGEGYFRREWKLAVERTHDMAAGVPFLLPVVTDDTKESEALVPDEFMRVQWTRLDRGVPTPQFVGQVKKLLEEPRKATRAPAAMSATHGQQPESTPAPARKGPPAWIWAVAALVVVAAVGGYFLMRSPAPVPPVAAPAEAKPALTAIKPARISDKSIAVLPFSNMSEDKDSAFFTDGIHEDILTNLALIRELRVVSRTSVMPFRATTKSMRQIAQELGVTYILEGSVRRSGNKVRVTGQLIHAATDEHVWAKAYDRDLTDVFTIQAELSSQIATALKAALSPEEKELIARRPTENPAAYDLYLRARDVNNREGNTPAAKNRRIELLQRAVELDPGFAQAWGELANSCAFAYFGSEERMDERLAQAKVAIERAVQLAPDDPEVIGSLGTYYYYGFRDYARAAEQYERLGRLQPNAATVPSSLGLILRRQGRWTESLVQSKRAADLDPGNISYQRNLLATLQAARRWPEAIAVQRRIATLLPDNLREAYLLAELHFTASGSTREGDAFFAGLSVEQRSSPLGITLRKYWARSSGDFAEAVRLDRQLPYYDAEGQPHWRQAYAAALDLLALGDKEAAVARLGDFPAELRRRLQHEPRNVMYWSFLSGMEAIRGNKEEALRCSDRCLELMPESIDALDGGTYASFRARLYDFIGDKEKALAEYTRMLRVPTSRFMNVHELRRGFSTLHGDPRFQALLEDPQNNAPLF